MPLLSHLNIRNNAYNCFQATTFDFIWVELHSGPPLWYVKVEAYWGGKKRPTVFTWFQQVTEYMQCYILTSPVEATTVYYSQGSHGRINEVSCAVTCKRHQSTKQLFPCMMGIQSLKHRKLMLFGNPVVFCPISSCSWGRPGSPRLHQVALCFRASQLTLETFVKQLNCTLTIPIFAWKFTLWWKVPSDYLHCG